MSDLVKRYTWLWQLLTGAAIAGAAWMQIQAAQVALGASLRSTEQRLARHEDADRDVQARQEQILITLGRLEERLKAVQDQIGNKR